MALKAARGCFGLVARKCNLLSGAEGHGASLLASAEVVLGSPRARRSPGVRAHRGVQAAKVDGHLQGQSQQALVKP